MLDRVLNSEASTSRQIQVSSLSNFVSDSSYSEIVIPMYSRLFLFSISYHYTNRLLPSHISSLHNLKLIPFSYKILPDSSFSIYSCHILLIFHIITILSNGELYQNMNTRVPSEPRYALRKRNHPQLQQNTILLTHEFEKLSIQ